MEGGIKETPAIGLPPTTRRTRRERRPSGAPPPLPRKLGSSGKVWLALAAVAIVALVVLPVVGQPAPAARFENRILRAFADRRTPWLSDVLGFVNTAGSVWGPPVLGWGTVIALVAVRRWRHLFTFLGSFMALALVGTAIIDSVSRPRPFGVTIIGDWGGYAMPSASVAVLTAILVSIAYSMVPAGRGRTRAKWATAGVVAVFCVARLYLAIDNVSDVVHGVILGVTFPLLAFRLFTPSEAFPVEYRRGKKAHLDVGGERGRAIREAIEKQLGLTVLEVKPIGLAGSGGSTPLRLRVAGEPDTYLFAKLYAKNHLMADRWYKLGRSILYGAMEDEAPFHTVRRFVESEDYTLRLLNDFGIPTAEPYGIVEITPEREYMLVMGFLEGAQEISEAEVDDEVIDNGLELVRKLWDSGLAHRDIKPANLLVRDKCVYLIDPFFVQVRPSPWRQAVDLANMMLVLAVRTDAPRVYARALRWFTPEEIAESFAATRGVASPTQLRAAMKADGRDLLAEFRRLAPHRPPIAIQRWSVKRVGTALLVLSVFALAVTQTVNLFRSVHNIPVENPPECGAGNTMLLMAQSVPSADLLPCIAGLPSGWSFGRADIHNGRTWFYLRSDRSGDRALTVTLTARCDVAGTAQVSTDEAGTDRFQAPITTARAPLVRTYVFPGGCAIYRFSAAAAATPDEVFFGERALSFTPRSELVASVERTLDLSLCGRHAPPCAPRG